MDGADYNTPQRSGGIVWEGYSCPKKGIAKQEANPLFDCVIPMSPLELAVLFVRCDHIFRKVMIDGVFKGHLEPFGQG